MSRPLDRNAKVPELGDVDREGGEFWVENPFQMPGAGYNLSAYERNRLFVNAAGEGFVDATFSSAAGLDSDSRSAIAADFDRDGAPDLLVGSVGGGPVRLLRNRAVVSGGWTRIELIGVESNRQGVGARLTATVGGRSLRRDVFPANGGTGMGPVETLIGLGGARRIDTLEILWPSGKRQTLEGLPAGKVVTITEGKKDFHVGPMTPPQAVAAK